MTTGRTVEAAAKMLEVYLKDTPTTLQLVLCNASTWSSPPTQAEIIASIIAATNGYTFQNVLPTGNASTSGTRAEISYEDATVSLSSGTLDYTGYAIIRDSTEAVEYESFTSTRTLDSSAGAHTFTGMKAVQTV